MGKEGEQATDGERIIYSGKQVLWYGFLTFAPLVWYLPNMLVTSWPPLFSEFVINISLAVVGSVAALKTFRHASFALLRISAGLLGVLYASAVGYAAVYHMPRFFERTFG
jgi:hypothetical protein